MSIVYLNGEFMPIAQAKISPLDRGFLFGDGIYEVIPSYFGKMVGFSAHIDRMINGLAAIGINFNWEHIKWRELCEQLCSKNGKQALGVYLHVSRGADNKRFHGFPENVEPTIFAMTFAIPVSEQADKNTRQGYALKSMEDLRWQRCHIKSTALLGNVLHFQAGQEANCQEVLLYNDQKHLTEASASNIYIVKNGVVITPPLNHHILAGVTRKLMLDILRKDGSIPVEERIVTLVEAQNADEIWISSSSKEIAPITILDDKPIGDGHVGAVWQQAATLYSEHKFDY
ncbi:MAG: aminotransferase class IV [Alteromonadaceae bacterium]|nr:aminotransferase class IV [Alteromonadaceae bacterium]